MEVPDSPDTRTLVGTAAVFYAVLTGVGLGVLALQDIPAADAVFGEGQHVLRDCVVGAGTGLAVVAATWLARGWAPLKRLNDELRQAIGSPGTGAIAVLAITSAVGEEVLFRGALQPLIGLIPTAVLFALAHGGTSARLRLWALFAFGAGLLLGWLTWWTGNLIAAILCHLTINYFNLHLVAREPG